MTSPRELALQRAQDYARDRGWRQEPLTWEEVEALVKLIHRRTLDCCDCELAS